MRVSLILLAILLFCEGGCHSLWPDDDLVGDGHLVEVRPELPAFFGVDVDSIFRADIVVGAQDAVLTLDENIVVAGIVRVIVEGGVLMVRQCDGCRDFAPSPGAALRVASPTITSVKSSGMANVTAATNGARVGLESAGESRLTVTASGAESASMVASGSSTLTLAGPVPALTIGCSGESIAHSAGSSLTIDINASDSSNATARASAAVRVRASGASAVTVDGNPLQRDVITADAATVSFSTW